MLQKQKSRFSSFYREILLYFLAFFTPKWWICQDYIKTILVLNITEIFRQGVGVDNIRRINAMQNHIHNRNHIRQTFLFFTSKSISLKYLKLFCCQLTPTQIVVTLTQETRRTASPIINFFTNFRLHDLNNCPNQGSRRVIFSPIPSRISHILDFGFIEMG